MIRNPKLSRKDHPRKGDTTAQVNIPHSALKQGSLRGKKAIFIPEMNLTVFVDPGANIEEIKERYLKTRFVAKF